MHTALSQIHPTWLPLFQQETAQQYFVQLMAFLAQEQALNVDIFPPQQQWFRVFEQPLSDIKLIIIGQDPYIHKNQATGLSFSVPKQEKIPPSLKNIYKEMHSDLGIEPVSHGDLSRWFNEESIFLLNASLTVESGKAGSHLKHGWQRFTQAVIQHINLQCQHCVFLAWGAFAHRCCVNIDPVRHHVIKTSHPSPLGAYKTMKTAPAFLGSQCFSQANRYLINNQRSAINWSVD